MQKDCTPRNTAESAIPISHRTMIVRHAHGRTRSRRIERRAGNRNAVSDCIRSRNVGRCATDAGNRIADATRLKI
jgi:hypothetical protein